VAPPVTGWPPTKTGYRCPFGPVPLQNLQPYYGQLRPCVLHWYLILIGATDLEVSLHIKTTGSHVPCKSPSRNHAAFEPDAAWAGIQGSAQTCPEMTTDLGFDINDAFSTIHRRFAFARLSETHQSGYSHSFCNAHHHPPSIPTVWCYCCNSDLSRAASSICPDLFLERTGCQAERKL